MSKKIMAMLSVLLLGGVGADELADKANQVHEIIWTRFIGKDMIMYDYAGLNGEVILPTPEECGQNIPNALGWWSPVENGGFFNGMYLAALCDRYQFDPSPKLREEIKKLVAGLYKLQDAGNTPGFIARGVGSDGKCHYPASSNDQNFPWFLGLGKYLESGIPTDVERQACTERLVRQLEALQNNQWRIPGDKPGFVRGWWLDGEYAAVVHLLTACHVVYQATGDPKYLAMYYDFFNGQCRNQKTRNEILLAGPHNMADWSCWFLSNCQYAVSELARQETDQAVKAVLLQSLKTTGKMAAPYLSYYKRYGDTGKPSTFTPDWHLMMPPWSAQTNGDEAQKLAMEQIKVWSKVCPAIAREKNSLKPAWCAGWMVMLSQDPELIAQNQAEIEAAIRYVDYSGLYYATLYYVENLVYTIRLNAK